MLYSLHAAFRPPVLETLSASDVSVPCDRPAARATSSVRIVSSAGYRAPPSSTMCATPYLAACSSTVARSRTTQLRSRRFLDRAGSARSKSSPSRSPRPVRISPAERFAIRRRLAMAGVKTPAI